MRERVQATLGTAYVVATDDRPAQVRVQPGAAAAGGYRLADYVFVPAVAFPTIADDVRWEDVRAFWTGRPAAVSYLSAYAGAPTLFVDEAAQAALVALLGRPAEGTPVEVVPAAELVERVWAARPLAWTIVPFDELQPRLKALTLDGASVLTRRFDPAAYPLRMDYALTAPPGVAAQLGVQTEPWLNRDPERMTVLIMTGVTATGRATAWKMELNGVLYPALQVREILRDHDLLHISNEVSFAADCPYPEPNSDPVFCANPRYIELLRDIHTDIVELSGNHNEDWGPDAARLSLQMYQQEGWTHFAGGWNDVDATTPLTVTDHGNTLVFLGCNPVGPYYAWARPDWPGAAVCDYPAMYAQIGRARAAGALPIVTWQYWESYQYEPLPEQREDFRAMAEAGAAIVSGSQAHQAQGFDFDGETFIHYGLGNLFFDQMQTLGTRQEFADQHVFYEGRLLSTRLYTFLLEDFAQPRPMTPEERQTLLELTFRASGW